MWTYFWDMHTGASGQKTRWQYIFIEAEEEEVREIFQQRFHLDPDYHRRSQTEIFSTRMGFSSFQRNGVSKKRVCSFYGSTGKFLVKQKELSI